MPLTMLWILSSTLLTLNLYANSSFKELTTIGSKSSTELSLLIQHLAQAKLEYEDKADVINFTTLINNDLAKTSQANTIYLMKTEIYRSILKGIHLPKNVREKLSSTLVNSIQARLKTSEYSEFTKWLINFILEDFKYFSDNGILDNQKNISRYDSKNALILQHFEKKGHFLVPWLVAFEKLPPKEFQKIVTKTAISILKSISAKSYYYGHFTSKNSEEPENYIFKVPGIELPPTKTEEEKEPISLLDMAKARKKKAQNDMKKIAPDDLSKASEEIDELIETDKGEWKPK